MQEALACGKKRLTYVTAVTDRSADMGETSVVNMVQRVSKKNPLRAGRHEAAVERGSRGKSRLYGITSSRALPTSSAGYWYPPHYLVIISTSASEEKRSFGGDFFASARLREQFTGPAEKVARNPESATDFLFGQ